MRSIIKILLYGYLEKYRIKEVLTTTLQESRETQKIIMKYQGKRRGRERQRGKRKNVRKGKRRERE
jgi:hypothetical protein